MTKILNMATLQFQFINADATFSPQYLEIHHDFERAQKIEVENGMTLILDYEKYKNGIIWDDFIELDLETINKLKELTYYAEIIYSLEKIIKQFYYFDYSDRYKIQDLGQEAYKIINNITEPKFLLNLELHKKKHLEDLWHTLNKEVSILMNSNYRSSKRQNNKEAIEAIKYLESDINSFINGLKYFEVS